MRTTIRDSGQSPPPRVAYIQSTPHLYAGIGLRSQCFLGPTERGNEGGDVRVAKTLRQGWQDPGSSITLSVDAGIGPTSVVVYFSSRNDHQGEQHDARNG